MSPCTRRDSLLSCYPSGDTSIVSTPTASAISTSAAIITVLLRHGGHLMNLASGGFKIYPAYWLLLIGTGLYTGTVFEVRRMSIVAAYSP